MLPSKSHPYHENEREVAIHLRAPEERDVEFMYQCENDTSLWESSALNTYYSTLTLRRLVEMNCQPIEETRQLRLIGEDQQHEPVGILDLFDIDLRHARASIGILIYPPSRWGQGLGKELLRIGIVHAQRHLLLHQLYAEIFTTHPRSLSLFHGAGFRTVGIRREWYKTSTGWADVECLQYLLTEK